MQHLCGTDMTHSICSSLLKSSIVGLILPRFVRFHLVPFMFSTIRCQPILSACKYARDTIILDSPCPFVAPHIIISPPPPQNPWNPWENATNDPQDCGYGRYLVVPSRSVQFINQPVWEPTDTSSSSTWDDDADLSESESRPESPEPETPVDEEDTLSKYQQEILDDLDFFNENSLLDLVIPVTEDPAWAKDFSSPSSQMFVDDDDEDDLPPFDDWYQSVARRTHLMV